MSQLGSQKQGHKIGLYKRGKFSPEKVNVTHLSKEHITTKTYGEKDTAWSMQFSKKSIEIKINHFHMLNRLVIKGKETNNDN